MTTNQVAQMEWLPAPRFPAAPGPVFLARIPLRVSLLRVSFFQVFSPASLLLSRLVSPPPPPRPNLHGYLSLSALPAGANHSRICWSRVHPSPAVRADAARPRPRRHPTAAKLHSPFRASCLCVCGANPPRSAAAVRGCPLASATLTVTPCSCSCHRTFKITSNNIGRRCRTPTSALSGFLSLARNVPTC